MLTYTHTLSHRHPGTHSYTLTPRCTNIHTHTHTHLYTFTHNTLIHTHIHTCILTETHGDTPIHSYTLTPRHIHIHTHTCKQSHTQTHKQELLTPTSANTPQSQEYINHLHRMMTDKSQFVDKMEYNPDFGNINTKLIAFYLPQFHLFKENEQWHGRGFTEWTNVTKAIPHFTGHIQPQLPIDVGFYDLSNIDVMARQAELAKQYGVHGFCFHYYWFSGKKLMEKPIYNWLNHPEIDFPFCLCWANENWSRLWDGGNKEVLMKQELLDGDDKKFADDIIPFFQDKRYIKIDGKPLFVVYRPKLFEQERFNKFIDILKSECKKVGIPDIYVLVSNSFGFNEAPSQWSANGIVEFPPHSMNYIWANKEFIFSNSKITVVDAIDYIKNKKYMYETEHNVFKTVFPSWDNTARKAYTGATCFFGETPQLYRQWLSDCIQWTRENHPKNEQIVFVNAWNEWAEGAHLEPDHYYGYAYLEETKNALLDSSARTKKIIYVGHDANFYGAQLLTLNIIKSMHEKFGYNVELLLLNDGELISEYRKYANVRVLANKTQNEIYDIVSDLKSRAYNSAVTNTIITGNITDVLKRCDITPISLIHELPKIIKHYHAESAGESIAKNSGKIISASSYVSNAFAELFGPDENKLAVIPQGLYKTNPLANDTARVRKELRQELNIPQNAKIALFVGMADRRKGTDLYFDILDKVASKHKDIYFVLVGAIEPDILEEKKDIVEKHAKNLIMCGKQTDTSKYYAGADIFLLTSREDPFPSVVMEAFECGLPVVGFKNAGGFSDIVNNNTGKLVAFEDTNAMAKEVVKILGDKKLLATIATNTRKLIADKFDWDSYVGKLLDLCNDTIKKVSVVVPNYNYANYIEQRLDSIVSQTYPIHEIIVLDDCSSDNSLAVIEKFASDNNANIKIVPNETNSGSVFNQWAKGIEMATGDYIWIAEADDLAHPTFLAENIAKFDNQDVVLSYSQSKIIDENGKTTSDDYLFYTNDISTTKWNTDYVNDGLDEIKTALCVKNTIPNVSGVVFKRFDIAPYLSDIKTYRVGGDLYLYLQLLRKGSIAFCAKALNMHRRHSGSVTVSKENNQKHFNEIVALQELAATISEPDTATAEVVQKYRQQVKEYLLGDE